MIKSAKVGDIVGSQCFDEIAEHFDGMAPMAICARCGRECLGYRISELAADMDTKTSPDVSG